MKMFKSIFKGLFISLIFMAVTGFMVFFDLKDRVANGRDCVSWPTTQGEILKSKVKHETDSDGHGYYAPYVWYKYFVNGKVYGSNVMSFSAGRHHTENDAKNIIANYPVGHKMDVYYNPRHPKTATLKTGIDTPTKIAYYAISAAFCIASLIFMFLILKLVLAVAFAIRSKKPNVKNIGLSHSQSGANLKIQDDGFDM